jgi:carbonic anhydrase/acetyltransferase-like protein (isoleucine patch superfamily)
MPVIPYNSIYPRISHNTFIAPDAWIIGDVELEENVSVFFSSVLRGDIQPIRIGAGTNIQEFSQLHTSYEMDPVTIGKGVTVGHRAILHGCTVGDNCIIGMGATVLDNAVIGAGSIVGAHTLIPKGKTFPPRSLIIGSPGRVIREITDDELSEIIDNAKRYEMTGQTYHSYFSGDSKT